MQNLEIKTRYPNHRRAARLAIDQVDAVYSGQLVQTDTYYHVAAGRLKMRHERLHSLLSSSWDEERFELIHYHRVNERAARASHYEVLPVYDGAKTLRFLSAALGVKVRIDKARDLYLKDNLRIHLDRVRGLGRFLEFELIVSRANPLSQCRKRMHELVALFGITAGDLVACSYSDLLLDRARGS